MAVTVSQLIRRRSGEDKVDKRAYGKKPFQISVFSFRFDHESIYTVNQAA